MGSVAGPMDTSNLLTVPQGSFELRRLHHAPTSPLRAWDAADAYALSHLAELERAGLDLPGRSITTVNDAHGALTVALADHRPVALSDSFVSWAATVANLERDDARRGSPDQIRPLTSRRMFCSPDGGRGLVTAGALPPVIDVAIVKVPKTLGLLDLELGTLAPRLAPDAVVIGAGMARHIHASTLQLFERHIGPTTTSLAHRKARLVHAAPPQASPRAEAVGTRPRHPAGANPTGVDSVDTGGPSLPTGPGAWSRYALPGSGATVISGPGVFAEGKLDIGTRLLVEHLASRPPGDAAVDVIDLGCGDGAVGISILLAGPNARVTFVDESTVALRSAQASVQANDDATRTLRARSHFLLGDALDAVLPFTDASGWSAHEVAGAEPCSPASADLVVINPPFHDDHAVGDAIAWRMLTGAQRVLRPGGEVLVVGNRHLGYHAKLARLFGDATVVASNPKFVVLSARR